MELHGKNLIGGVPTSLGQGTFRRRRTGHADGRSSRRIAKPSRREVDRALRSRRRSVRIVSAALGGKICAKFLREIATQIESLGEELIDRANRETASWRRAICAASAAAPRRSFGCLPI